LFQIFVGSSENASFEWDGVSASNPLKLSLLEDSQELCLHWRRQFADLVEEEGSVFGCLELSFPYGDCAGECALFVSEELAFK
jgi:hypothetical protein